MATYPKVWAVLPRDLAGGAAGWAREAPYNPLGFVPYNSGAPFNSASYDNRASYYENSSYNCSSSYYRSSSYYSHSRPYSGASSYNSTSSYAGAGSFNSFNRPKARKKYMPSSNSFAGDSFTAFDQEREMEEQKEEERRLLQKLQMQAGWEDEDEVVEVGRKWGDNPQDAAVLPDVKEKVEEQRKVEAVKEEDVDMLMWRPKVVAEEEEERKNYSRRNVKKEKKGGASEEIIGEEENKQKDGNRDEASKEGKNRENGTKTKDSEVRRCRKVNRKRKGQSKEALMENIVVKRENEKSDMERREELAGMREEARLKRLELALRIGEQLEVEAEAKEFWRQVPLEEMRKVKEKIQLQEKEERMKAREKEQEEKMERKVRGGGIGTKDEKKAMLVAKVLGMESEAIIQAYHDGGPGDGGVYRLP